jgi:O-antigen ligase
MLVVFSLFFLSSFYLALARPSNFLIFYVLASTKFLGYFDLGIFVFNGFDVGFVSLNLATLFAAFFKKRPLNFCKFILPMYVVVFFLIIWGFVIPVSNSFETILQAFIASKSFLYFSILFYAFNRRARINSNQLIRFLKFIGIYFVGVYMFNIVTGIVPPFYNESYDGYVNYIRVFYPTYISLALFIFYADWQNKKLSGYNFLAIFVLLIIGLIFSGHFALTAGTLISLLLAYVVWHRNKTFAFTQSLQSVGTIVILLFVTFLSSSTTRENTVDTVDAILDGSHAALISRARYNEFRWKAIDQHPLTGYGFLHPDAAIMKNFETSSTSRFMKNLGVIDSGYVDLLVRFGYLGTGAYLLIVCTYLFGVLSSKPSSYYSLAMYAFVFQFFLVNFTWSVFSYSHGIIPMILAFYIIYDSDRDAVHKLNTRASGLI